MNAVTMKSAALLDRPLRHRPWRPRYLRWVMQDLAGVARQPEHDHRTHLRATLEWVCRAQDACRAPADSGSVAAGWTFAAGWLPASTEATGWLIETMLPAAEYLAWPALQDRARAMLAALLAQADAGLPGRIHGLIAGHVQLGDAEALARAVRCGRLLADLPQSSAAQHARTAHALAALGVAAGEPGLTAAARRHLDAALAQQTPCGWFADPTGHASTSALASIARSLIESFRLLGDERARVAVLRATHGLRDHLHRDGRLAGAFDDGWMPAGSYVDLTGLTQLAGCWLRLAQVDRQALLRDAAWRAVAWVKRNQRVSGGDLALRAALPNAVPIWCGPGAFGFDTLSAKHFADALMMDMVGIAIPPEMDEKNG